MSKHGNKVVVIAVSHPMKGVSHVINLPVALMPSWKDF